MNIGGEIPRAVKYPRHEMDVDFTVQMTLSPLNSYGGQYSLGVVKITPNFQEEGLSPGEENYCACWSADVTKGKLVHFIFDVSKKEISIDIVPNSARWHQDRLARNPGADRHLWELDTNPMHVWGDQILGLDYDTPGFALNWPEASELASRRMDPEPVDTLYHVPRQIAIGHGPFYGDDDFTILVRNAGYMLWDFRPGENDGSFRALNQLSNSRGEYWQEGVNLTGEDAENWGGEETSIMYGGFSCHGFVMRSRVFEGKLCVDPQHRIRP